MPHFPRKSFQFCQLKICKKLKKAIFKCPQYLLLSSRKLQNHFLRIFLWSNYDLNNFQHFTSLSQKMVSTSSIKNLERTKKCYFWMPTIFVLSSRKLQNQFLRSSFWSNFDLNSFWCFASLSQKMVSISSLKNCKKLKLPFSNAQNIHFWDQAGFKTIF